MRIRRRSFGLQITVLLLTGIVVLARYWYNVGFDQKYRQLLSDELARYGLGAEIGRLTIDPVAGLIARDVALFDLKQPELKLAGINRIALDIDLARLVNKEEFLRSITLSRAHLSLPVDPGDRESEWIRVSDLNARLVINGRQIEIASAEANLDGLQISVRGDITRAAPSGPPDPEAEKKKREQQLREMRDRRGALRRVLRILDRFKVPGGPDGQPRAAGLAKMQLEVHGDLSDLDTASVHVTLQGKKVRCGNFEAREFDADAILEDGELNLRRLNVVDNTGTFSATASWKIRQSDSVAFAVDSSVDLLSLLHGAVPGVVLPDTVTAAATPRFRASGVLHAGRLLSDEPSSPLQALDVTGFIDAGAFTVKGETYESLHTDFALRQDGFIYLRNVDIKHAGGRLRGQFMRRAEDSRYECSLDTNMAALAPLLALPAMEKPLALVTWTDQSRLQVNCAGTGSADGRTWQHRGTVDARDYRLRGSFIRQGRGEVAVGPGSFPEITVNNFLLRREDGDITGKEAVIDQTNAVMHVKGIASSCMPSPAAAMFAPKIGDILARYYFEAPPRVEMEGTIGLKTPEANNLRIKLQSPAVCGLPVASQDWRFTGVSGNLLLKKDTIAVNLSGRALPRQKFTSFVRFDSAAPLRIAGVFGTRAENAVSASKYTVNVESPDNTRLLLFSREFPIDRLNATVRVDGGKLAILAGGHLYEGRLAANLEFPEMAKGGHSATVTIERVNFNSLTSLFGAKDETGGFVSGRFSYQTPDGNGPTIEGTGAAGLEEGNIFALPLLGPLSTVISALLPGDRIAYSVARKATCTFLVSRGRVTMTDFEAATRTFRLTVDGAIDIVRDSVDLNARVNLRGAPGLLLYPVSKLFEYRAAGSIGEPGWRPKLLSRPRRSRGEPDPAEED